jgi:beta-glucosidase
VTWPDGFLWGAATSAHQIEGNNNTSDWWAFELTGHARIQEHSGDAADGLHRWEQDLDLLAGAGFTDYRFGIEWARIEPARGELSQVWLRHYRDVIEGALLRGLRPFVTLHHFTSPRWFTEGGGWSAPDAADLFTRYVAAVSPLLDGVDRVCTINEPNMVALFPALFRGAAIEPDDDATHGLIAAHHAARERLRGLQPAAEVGWSVACHNHYGWPAGGAAPFDAYVRARETVFLEAAAQDDWIGVQTYTRTRLCLVDGAVQPMEPMAPDDGPTTLTGWEVHPGAVGDAVRHVAGVLPHVPIIVTENGIATDDDAQRRDYTERALASLRDTIAEGIDVRGYFHWSLLDNYEWGSYTPTFGLVAVDRTTFDRAPKPSLAWLGSQRHTT